MDDRHNLTATDEAIDRKLGQLLSVDPAPEFLARVRMQIAHDETNKTRSFGPLVAIAVCVFVAAVALWVTYTPDEPSEVQTATQAPGPPVVRALPAELPTGTSAVGKARNIHAKVYKSRPLTPQPATEPMPEVLISPSEAAAFEQLLVSTRERRFEISADSVARLTDTGSRTDLAIAPMAIDVLSPVEPLAPSEGVNQ
jgi:hypothetical protein